MIGKLVKKDLKDITKILVYIYVITLVLAVITRLINIGKDIQFLRIVGAVFTGCTYSGIASILINTFVHILRVFISSFYKDESYLTHTLPVKKKTLLLSKYLASFVAILMSFIVCLVSALIMLLSKEFIDTIKNLLMATLSGFSLPIWLMILVFALIILFEICCLVSISFTAVIKGNQYNKKRVGKGLMWFAVYYLATTIISLVVIGIVFAIGGNLDALLSTNMSETAFITTLIVALILYFVYSIVFYFISLKEFNKGVNVD